MRMHVHIYMYFHYSSSIQEFSNNIRFKTLQLFVPNSKRLGATLSECTFFFEKAHVTNKTSSRQTTSRPQDKKNPDRAISEFFFIKNPGICSGALR